MPVQVANEMLSSKPRLLLSSRETWFHSKLYSFDLMEIEDDKLDCQKYLRTFSIFRFNRAFVDGLPCKTTIALVELFMMWSMYL